MNIGVICNLNLARSPLITSFLRKNYQNHHFFSAGVSVSRSFDYPSSVTRISKNWDLPLEEKPNTDLTQVDHYIQSADLLICADEIVFSVCKNLYPNKEIFNLAELAIEYKLEISDPIDLNHNDFKRVISLYIFLVNEYMGHIQGWKNRIFSIVPRDFQDLERTFISANVEARKLSKPIILNYNLRVPNLNWFTNNDFQVSRLLSLDSEQFEYSPSMIYTFAHEFLSPERYYLDQTWRQKILDLAKEFDLILILPPDLINGHPFVDRYLAALTSWTSHDT